MGGVCVKCGGTEKLEFHHKYVRMWRANRTSRHQRLVNYRREWRRGVIELMCHDCNRAAGTPTEHEPETNEVPF